MHQYTINACIQIVPIVANATKHPYVWVDEAIAIIQQSGIRYHVGPFATELEGSYSEVINVINAVNDYLCKQACPEWISNIQLQIRSQEAITGAEKTEAYR